MEGSTNGRRRHPSRLRCPMDPYAELRNIQNYMINSILRKHKYYQILQRHALTSRKRLFGVWFIKTILSCVN